ncbi:hypothetical protein TIFTF001_055896, partial [Ficus carica]
MPAVSPSLPPSNPTSETERPSLSLALPSPPSPPNRSDAGPPHPLPPKIRCRTPETTLVFFVARSPPSLTSTNAPFPYTTQIQ